MIRATAEGYRKKRAYGTDSRDPPSPQFSVKARSNVVEGITGAKRHNNSVFFPSAQQAQQLATSAYQLFSRAVVFFVLIGALAFLTKHGPPKERRTVSRVRETEPRSSFRRRRNG